MQATIRERRVLVGLQSASGLEQVGESFYVISDDSPFLFRLDANWNVAGKTRLFEIEMRDGERIAKGLKPDLEAICEVEWQGRKELLCFGSGSSSPTRDVCFRVDVTDAKAPQNIRRVELTALYDALRSNLDVVGTQSLNLEAACCTSDILLLFQRGNISGRSTSIEFGLHDFMTFLDAPHSMHPAPRVSAYHLPKLQGRAAGFSAAVEFEDGVLFAAAVEDTDNEIDDGAKLGSFVGCLRAGELSWIEPVMKDETIAEVKIEGVSVLSAREGLMELVAVTDDDEGASEVLWIEVG